MGERMDEGAKLLLTFDIREETQETYLRFMVNEFIPMLQTMGLKSIGVWHTAYGDYPVRLLVFSSESSAAMKQSVASEAFQELEGKLKKYVTEYNRRIVPFDSRFQF